MNARRIIVLYTITWILTRSSDPDVDPRSVVTGDYGRRGGGGAAASSGRFHERVGEINLVFCYKDQRHDNFSHIDSDNMEHQTAHELGVSRVGRRC